MKIGLSMDGEGNNFLGVDKPAQTTTVEGKVAQQPAEASGNGGWYFFFFFLAWNLFWFIYMHKAHICVKVAHMS